MLKFKSYDFIAYKDAVLKMEEHVLGLNENTIWFTEHESVYSKGSSAKDEDLLAPLFPVYETGRGGQLAYHGPGQLMVYVMVRLTGLDLRAYVKALQDAVIYVLNHFDVESFIVPERVGVWVKNNSQEKKIAAIGVRVTRGMTYHGLSFNISPDLSHYKGIVPCGIKDYGVTSLSDLGIQSSRSEVELLFQEAFVQSAFFKSFFTNSLC